MADQGALLLEETLETEGEAEELSSAGGEAAQAAPSSGWPGAGGAGAAAAGPARAEAEATTEVEQEARH